MKSHLIDHNAYKKLSAYDAQISPQDHIHIDKRYSIHKTQLLETLK